MKNKLFITGIIGTVAAALCCFTPILAIALPAVGLGGLVAYLYYDAVLLPVLAVFLAITAFGFWRGRAA